MKLRFLESLMDKNSKIDVDLTPIYETGYEPIYYNGKITHDDLKSVMPVNSYSAWYDENGKFDNIYRLRYYEDSNGLEIAFFQPITSFFNGWWVPARGLEDDINEGKVIPLRKKDDKDFTNYSGEDTELDD